MEEQREQFDENREGEIIEQYPLIRKEGDEERTEIVTVRFAKKDDAESLAEVDRDRARYRLEKYKMEEYRNLLEDEEFGELTRDNLEKSLVEPDKLCFIVAETEDDIVGYVEFCPSLTFGKNSIRIRTLSVKEAYHGQGCGAELLKQVIEKAKEIYGAKRIGLNTHNWNKPARDLYKKFGFKQDGEPEPEIDRKINDGKPRMAFDKKQGKMIVSKKIRMVKEL